MTKEEIVDLVGDLLLSMVKKIDEANGPSYAAKNPTMVMEATKLCADIINKTEKSKLHEITVLYNGYPLFTFDSYDKRPREFMTVLQEWIRSVELYGTIKVTKLLAGKSVFKFIKDHFLLGFIPCEEYDLLQHNTAVLTYDVQQHITVLHEGHEKLSFTVQDTDPYQDRLNVMTKVAEHISMLETWGSVKIPKVLLSNEAFNYLMGPTHIGGVPCEPGQHVRAYHIVLM